MKQQWLCTFMVAGFLVFSGCGRTMEHVFVDNANKCETRQFQFAFGTVENVGSNDLKISPLEVKSALMQAFDENGCIEILPSSTNIAKATYTTRIENVDKKGLIYSNDQVKLAVDISLILQNTTKQQIISSSGYLDVNNEKYLTIGASHQINLTDKTYTLSIASRTLSKTLSDTLLNSAHTTQEAATPLPDIVEFEVIDLNTSAKE